MIAATLLMVSTIVATSPADIADLFEAREYRYTGGQYRQQLFRYRLFVPRSPKPGEHYPLLIWLHGYGERGSDNVKNLRWLELVLDNRKHIERYRFFILATQSPDGSWGSGAVALPDDMLTVTTAIFQKTLQEYPVDPNRVWLSGVSGGGSACWEMAMRHPEWFAAVVPMGSGGGDVSHAGKLVNIPIWAFHNLNDRETSPEDVKRMVAAVNAAGGNAHLTLLEGKWRESSDAWSEWWWSHDCWTEAFHRYDIMAWMLAQDRGSWVCWTPPGCRLWKWWHILTVPCIFLTVVWLGCCFERRRRERKRLHDATFDPMAIGERPFEK
jgi:predicted peptidase